MMQTYIIQAFVSDILFNRDIHEMEYAAVSKELLQSQVSVQNDRQTWTLSDSSSLVDAFWNVFLPKAAQVVIPLARMIVRLVNPVWL